MKRVFFLSKNPLLKKMLTYVAGERSIPFYELDDLSEANFRIEEFGAEIVLVEWGSYKSDDLLVINNLSKHVFLVTEDEIESVKLKIITPKLLVKPLSPLNWYERLVEVG